MLSKVKDYDMKGIKLTKKINNTFYERAIYGKMFASRFLPDYREIYDIEREKRKLIFYNELVELNQVNAFTRIILRKDMKN